MRKRQTRSAVGKNKPAENITHVLLQTDEELVLGTTNQVKSSGKENLQIGMTTTLTNGRKRTHSTIVCLGTSAQCPQTQKTISQSSSNSLVEPVSLSESVDKNQKDSQLLIKDNQQRQDQKFSSIMPSRKSKVLHDQSQNTARKTISTNTKLSKTHHNVAQANSARDCTKEDVVVMDESHHTEKSVQKQKKANQRYEFEEENVVVAKKILHNKSSIEISQKAVGASSTISKKIETASGGTDEEEESALVIDESHSSVELVQKQSKTNKRKEFEEEEQVNVKRKSLNKPSKENTREDIDDSLMTSKPVKKKKQSKQTVANSTREINVLKNQLETIQRETFALPTGDAATFILLLADRIRSQGTGSDLTNEEQTISIGDRLADINELLRVSDADLELARHATDITKTVRQVTKIVYPDINQRQKMKISTMDQNVAKAIVDYARINHPFAPANIDLRSKIGNVFATDRQNLGSRGKARRSAVAEEDRPSSDQIRILCVLQKVKKLPTE